MRIRLIFTVAVATFSLVVLGLFTAAVYFSGLTTAQQFSAAGAIMAVGLPLGFLATYGAWTEDPFTPEPPPPPRPQNVARPPEYINFQHQR